MHLRGGGLDIFYIDESHDLSIYVATAICVPFLRQVEGQWSIVWGNHLNGAKQWRKRIRDVHHIPVAKELHATKLASGRGNFKRGKHNFDKPKATAIYRRILEDIDFIPDASIMSAVAVRGNQDLYGKQRIEAAMFGLFQRMRTKCQKTNVNAITFFDQGHDEYRKLYRRAMVNLPTGSKFGPSTRNLPLDMFVKDANMKSSKHCYFTQTADLVAYAAFLKIKGERGVLEDWQERYAANNLYDSIPGRSLNRAASPHGDAIVRL